MAGLACPVYRARTFESSSLYLLTGKKCPSFTNSDFTDWVDIPGGGGGHSTKFYKGRLRPEVQTLTLLYAIFERKGIPFVYLS